MATFSTKFLHEISESLSQLKEKVEHELAQFTIRKGSDEYQAKFPDYGSKDDENAEEVATHETNLRLEETLENELRDVTSSLDRISKGTYGICKYCKKPIAEERLRARPTSSSCIECKKTITQEI